MPLYDVDRCSFLNRKRIFLRSEDRLNPTQGSKYYAKYQLQTEVEKVVSVELVGYNFNKGIMPTFIAPFTRYDGIMVNGNNFLDIKLTDASDVNPPLTFSVEFPEGRFTTVAALAAALPGYIEAAMDAQGSSFYNTSNSVEWQVAEDTSVQGASIFVIQCLLGVDNTAIVSQFLFGTGANSANSCWHVLGFQKGVDTTLITLPSFSLYDPIPVRQPTIRPFRFCDITIDEFPELTPLARISLQDMELSVVTDRDLPSDLVFQPREMTLTPNSYLTPKPRLLTEEPPRRLRELTVRINFQDNIVPLEEFDEDYDLVLELLVVSPEQTIPSWTKQTVVI